MGYNLLNMIQLIILLHLKLNNEQHSKQYIGKETNIFEVEFHSHNLVITPKNGVGVERFNKDL